uniref:Secreted protein n=1 Tax=Ixodes ricinus TaxID=34613 RepID=A0A6B0U3Q7_IXORI
MVLSFSSLSALSASSSAAILIASPFCRSPSARAERSSLRSCGRSTRIFFASSRRALKLLRRDASSSWEALRRSLSSAASSPAFASWAFAN